LNINNLNIPDDLNVQQIDIKPGLGLVLADFQPGGALCIGFETGAVPFEFAYHLSGGARYTVEHRQGKTCFDGNPGLNVVSAFSHSKGSMAFSARVPIRMVAIHIQPRFFAEILKDQPDGGDPDLQEALQQYGSFFNARPSRMTPAMCVAANQMLACPYYGVTRQMFLESKTLELMALQLEERSSRASAPIDRHPVNPNDLMRVRRARDILLRDWQDPPTLFQLARKVGLTHTRLNRGFRAMYGTTVFEYLRRHRLEESRLLIHDAEMNIAEIAYATGFSSPSHFSRAFLNRFGIQPSAYLKDVLRRRVISVRNV
jgi:AraC family transcriptional activator of pyochelin receptor